MFICGNIAYRQGLHAVFNAGMMCCVMALHKITNVFYVSVNPRACNLDYFNF